MEKIAAAGNRLEANTGIAYLVNIVIGALLVAGLFLLAYFAPRYTVDFDVFKFVVESTGISPALFFAAGAILAVLYAVYRVNSMTSYSVTFEGSTLTYTGGGLLKETKSVSVSDITRVNYREFPFFKFGDLTLEIDGEKKKELIVEYLPDTRKRCQEINAMIGGAMPEEEEPEETEEAPEGKVSLAEEMIGYIEDELDQGYGLEQIKNDLVKEGYPRETISAAADYVAKHRKISRKGREKVLPKTDEHHFQRHFNLPLMSIAAVILTLIVIFMFVRLGEEEKEMPEQIDIFLYDNLGISYPADRILGSMQIYSRDELQDSTRADLVLEQNRGNTLLSNLGVSEAVKGFQKRATVFDITGAGGVHKKTLIEIRFQADRDIDTLKIVESIPKTTAAAGELELTQGGVLAEKDPIILFTFNDVTAGRAIKAVYVINKELKGLETLTFAAEARQQAAPKPAVQRVCGDGKCVEGENYMSCCTDCGCLPGFICERNACVAAEKDECQQNADCDDGEASTADVCSGRPKTCQNTPITECMTGDGYCPEACMYDQDNDCEPMLIAPEEPVDLSTLNITGQQEPPKIEYANVTPNELMIGDEFLVEAKVTDANGKDDIENVWVEIMELAQSHGETGDMNDNGELGDKRAGDDIYSVGGYVAEYYVTGQYHANIFAQDRAGNKKKFQVTFRVT
ncbi:hypothetical protein KY359_05405 [Candidatus Woesearchaeota archaeon]|nr:hypothetical protein [Candidatus Woesearchaeota archaeon]